MGKERVMIRVGFVGAGDICRVHARTLQSIADVRLAGVLDVAPGRAEAFATEFATTAYQEVDALLEACDAVYIGTPPMFHRDPAIAAAEAGVHIFCEKPLAVTVADARAIEAAVTRAGVFFQIGFHSRFIAGFMRMKELLDAGEIGDIYNFWLNRVQWLAHLAPNWRTDPRFICGMTIESLAHDFDVMRWMVGDPRSAIGLTNTSRPDLTGYDNIMTAMLPLRNGGMASFLSSWASHVFDLDFGVIGTRGTVVLHNGVVRWKGEGMATEECVDFNALKNLPSPHQLETEHFIASLQEGRPPSVTVQDGVATLVISHAVLQSVSEQRMVPITLDETAGA
jgi:myo-inositol 2-dehydrogenase/D-chiro-inositol 1-dehydrogenase